jgi:uncharacterized protein (DUF58 family)
MRAPLRWLTRRGWSFVAAGGAAIGCGLGIPEPDLLRIGALLVVLPAVSALVTLTFRHRVSCSWTLDPARVPAGQPATVTVRVRNVSRRRTGVLLAEDLIPAPLASRPRFLLDGIEPGGHRELSHQIRPDSRGRFSLGPLRVAVADPFGLVQFSRSYGATSTLMVTPRIFPLPPATAPRSGPGEGNGGMHTIPGVGEDDSGPRAYQQRDGLRRVHWKSTARYGELMVRREEHQRHDGASVFLDTRRSAHSGGGAASTFEFAVSAAASISAHLSGAGVQARLITEAGDLAPRGSGQDTLLDTLAVISPSGDVSLEPGMSALASAGGQLIAVVGRLSPQDARQLAASRRGNAPAMALLLAVSGWDSDAIDEDTGHAAEVLSVAGWQVAMAAASTPLAAAWQQWHRPAGQPLTVGDPAGSGGAQR